MKIRFDGKDYDLSKPEDAAAFQQAVTDFTTRHTVALEKEKARADAAETDAKKLRADAVDTARFDAAVDARVALNTSAAQVLGASYVTKGKSEREIMIDVVRADDKDFTGKGPSGRDATGEDRHIEYVRARFDAVLAKGIRADSIQNLPVVLGNLGAAPGATGATGPAVRNDAIPTFNAEESRIKMVDANRTAWQKPPQAN